MPEDPGYKPGAGLDLFNLSVRGGFWLLARRILSNGLKLVAIGILARQLDAASFGLVAFAQVVFAFIALGGDGGVGTYVIQERSASWRERVDEAFSVNLVFAVAVLLVASVPLAVTQDVGANFPSILIVVAAAFVFRQLSAVPEALLRREFHYGRLFARDASADALGATASVAMALSEFGIWSLVFPQVLVEAARFSIVAKLSSWRPKWRLTKTGGLHVARFMGHSTGQQVLNLAANDLDSLFVGKYLGISALGFYNIAWQLSNFVGRNLMGPVVSITTSSLAALKHSELRLTNAYVRMLRILAVTAFPFLAMIFAAADPLILVVYGQGWQTSVPLLRLFIILAAVRIVTSPAGAVCGVMGRPDVGFRFAAGFLPFYIAAVIIGLPFGLYGVCVGVVAVRVLGALLWMVVAGRLIGIAPSAFIRPLLPTTVASSSLAAAGYIVLQLQWAGSLPPLTQIACAVFIVGPAYLTALAHFDRRSLDEVVRMVTTVFPVVVAWRRKRLAETA